MRSLMVGRLVRVASAIVIILLAGCGTKPLTFEPGNVESLDARTCDEGEPQKATQVTIHDTAKIEALLAVLRKGTPTPDHKCGDDGHMTLHQKDGRKLEVGILAGHDTRYYEFRVYRGNDDGYDMFRAERAPFLKAMAGLGLDGSGPNGQTATKPVESGWHRTE